MTNPDDPSTGWYPDPHGGPGQTYRDGGQWRPDGPGQADAGNSAQQPLGQAPEVVDPHPGGLAHSTGPAAHGQPLSDKSKLVAGLLQIFLSPFAVGRFYLGYPNVAAVQIVVTICTCGLGAWWPIIDGILIIMGRVSDPEGRALRE